MNSRLLQRLLLASVLVAVGPAYGQDASQAAKPATAEEAAKRFNALVEEWQGKTDEIAAAKTPADKDRVRAEALAMLDRIVAAGLDVYRLDSKNYPQVNQTLVAVANFYVSGDPTGDGGDQYEKALPLVDTLIAGGAAEKMPDLYLWGAVSALTTNQFDKAKDYYEKADAAGANGRSDPRAAQLAMHLRGGLDQLSEDWQKEEKIREAEAAADNLPRVKMTTSKGDVVIELFENEAPEATANFLSLVKKGFYNGVVFHRVLPGFMAQGGDPTGTGSGGPGYCIRCECHKPGYRRHFRGSLSMAHAGRDTGGSQFFLTFVPTDYLNGKHTVFGRVVEGMDVAASIRRRNPDDPSAPTPDKIIKAEVLRDRGHGYEFEKLPER